MRQRVGVPANRFPGLHPQPRLSHYVDLTNGCLTVSAALVLLIPGLIRYEASNINHGGEINNEKAPVSYSFPVSAFSPACCTCWVS